MLCSWLRHVKKCQLVQTNWKPSPKWVLREESKLKAIREEIENFYYDQHGYEIFKRNAQGQLLKQAECDLIGMCRQEDCCTYFAVDVAFHKAGLGYKKNNVLKVLEKCARAALALDGHFDARNAEIIFATPKVSSSVLKKIEECLEELNEIYKNHGRSYKFGIIANDVFVESVLKPILAIADEISDTSELFLRSYQMYKMFDITSKKGKVEIVSDNNISDDYSELKVGEIARSVLGPMLTDGCATEEEIEALQTAEYSRKLLGIQYPLLKKTEAEYERHPHHYYSHPISIYGVKYFLCCEWFEQASNNDRPPLIEWIKRHKNHNSY